MESPKYKEIYIRVRVNYLEEYCIHMDIKSTEYQCMSLVRDRTFIELKLVKPIKSDASSHFDIKRRRYE